MTPVALGILFAVFGLIFAGIAVAASKRYMAQMNESWRTAADMLHFTFEPGTLGGGPTISGSIADHPATVTTYTKKSGRNSTRYTKFSVEFPPFGIGLSLSRQAGFGGFLKVLGAQDIEIGDPVFDDAFIVRAREPSRAREVLTPGTTMALNRLLAVHPEVVVFDNAVVLDRRGAVRDHQEIVSTLRRLESAATTLAESQLSGELTSMAEARLEGEIPDYEPSADVTIDERLTAGEALMVSGLAEAASRIFDSLAIEVPADIEVRGWSTTAKKRPIPPARPLASRGEPEPVRAADARSTVVSGPEETSEDAPELAGRVNTDPVGVATDLFGENRLSFETAAVFDEKYAGIPIEWLGKVRASQVVDDDRVLGDGPFTKTIVEVASLENDLFGNTVVSAVVEFSRDRHFSPGREITFTGTLVAVDALVRNLYVSSGRIV